MKDSIIHRLNSIGYWYISFIFFEGNGAKYACEPVK